MKKDQKRSEKIRQFIVSHVTKHPNDITRQTVRQFGISRQAVNQHLRRMIDEKIIVATGTTRNMRYRLHALHGQEKDGE